jgi:hypothetical protein
MKKEKEKKKGEILIRNHHVVACLLKEGNLAMSK